MQRLVLVRGPSCQPFIEICGENMRLFPYFFFIHKHTKLQVFQIKVYNNIIEELFNFKAGIILIGDGHITGAFRRELAVLGHRGVAGLLVAHVGARHHVLAEGVVLLRRAAH